jgi:hypothetical protein
LIRKKLEKLESADCASAHFGPARGHCSTGGLRPPRVCLPLMQAEAAIRPSVALHLQNSVVSRHGAIRWN